MIEARRISLDDPVLLSRLRGDFTPKTYQKRNTVQSKRFVNDVTPRTINITSKINHSEYWKAAPAEPLKLKIVSQNVLDTKNLEIVAEKPLSYIAKNLDHRVSTNKKKRRSLLRLDNAFVGMALVLFVTGLYIAYTGLKSDQISQVQAAKLTAQANKSYSSGNANAAPAIATVKPTATNMAAYTVVPNDPRYIRIPKLSVFSRVMGVGVDKQGALKTPNNVFDTAWYKQSALPGQPGAMLIDGHVSSWSSHGVFYGLKNLVPGDTMSIERGDGKVFNYEVVKTQVYDANNVDMTAAVTPVTKGTPGLNLISCDGTVKPGTNEFNQRIVVFTKQV